MSAYRGARPRSRRAAGFTMVELLIAGLMSALVLLAVYFVFLGNTAQYYRQEQIVQMQESMRFALELMKTDLRNAGRLGVVQGVRPDPWLCTNRPNLRTVRLFEGAAAGSPRVLDDNGNGLRPDRVQLLVDTGGAAMLRTRRVAGNQLVLAPPEAQPTAEAETITRSQPRLESVFRAGGLLSIRSPEGAVDVVPINGVGFAAGGSTIDLAQPLCGRVVGCAGCLVGGVQLVEYAVVERAEPEGRTDLVRRVLDARNPDRVLPDSTLTVAEYAVDLQVWGVPWQDAATRMVAERDLDPPREDRPGQPAIDAIEDVRALGVLLAVRTPREDEEFVVAPDRAVPAEERRAADRVWFELDGTPGTGLARVATLKAQVEATNLYRERDNAIR